MTKVLYNESRDVDYEMNNRKQLGYLGLYPRSGFNDALTFSMFGIGENLERLDLLVDAMDILASLRDGRLEL